MGSRDQSFVFVLQLDPAFHALLLVYTLTQPANINRAALPPEHCSAKAQWLYDEVELMGRTPLMCRHNILLSNGWEIELHFSNLEVLAVEPLLLTDAVRRRVAEAARLRVAAVPEPPSVRLPA